MPDKDPAGIPAAELRAQTACLTAREIQIVRQVVQGKPNKEIARELGISVRTVEAHRSHIVQKLRVGSLAELVYYALDHGLVPQRRKPTAAC